MNTQRLIRLAEHLETVVAQAPASFDMASWASKGECGTTACAFGHACAIPEFQAAGLKLFVAEDGTGEPRFGRDYGFAAAAAFFDLFTKEAYHLFADDEYPDSLAIGPLEVAARIRELVAGKAVSA